MKEYERVRNEVYFNLDIWKQEIGCWKKTTTSYESLDDAISAAKKPGQYRISKNENGRRVELEPFTIEGN